MVAGTKRLSMLGADSHVLERFRGGDSLRAESLSKNRSVEQMGQAMEGEWYLGQPDYVFHHTIGVSGVCGYGISCMLVDRLKRISLRVQRCFNRHRRYFSLRVSRAKIYIVDKMHLKALYLANTTTCPWLPTKWKRRQRRRGRSTRERESRRTFSELLDRKAAEAAVRCSAHRYMEDTIEHRPTCFGRHIIVRGGGGHR